MIVKGIPNTASFRYGAHYYKIIGKYDRSLYHEKTTKLISNNFARPA